LDVVDRDQDRTRACEPAHRRKRADRGFARLNAIVCARLATEKRNLERVSLRRGQGSEHRGADVREHVDEGGEGETRLERGRTAGKNAIRTLLCGADSCAPERGLADADGALEQKTAGTRRDPGDELANGRQLGFPSDHPRSRWVQYRRHLPSIPRVSRIGKGGSSPPCSRFDGVRFVLWFVGYPLVAGRGGAARALRRINSGSAA